MALPVRESQVMRIALWRLTGAVLVCVLGIALPAVAQQRPLVTEDPEPVGAGRLLIEAGVDYGRDVWFPASGLQGHLRRAPLLGLSIGLSSIAELQIDGGLHNRLFITRRDAGAPLAGVVTAEGDETTSVEDVVLATKIRIVSEGVDRPSMGVRFATRLPNASNESGLGLDTMDFLASFLIAKTVEQVRLVGNVGLGILSDPVIANRQNDVLTYGFSFARAVSPGAEFVGEINGRANTRRGIPTPGTESRSQIRVGGRYTAGSWRGDAALLFGVTSPDPDIGVAAGITWVFQAFELP
jgi:hypothetical protein